jgi:hypothetical protein
MALKIDIPDNPNTLQELTLASKTYILNSKYNSRSDRWNLTLKNTNNEVIIGGDRVITNQAFTVPHYLPSLDGVLIVIGDSTKVTRNNFGVDKAHELFYLTNDEYAVYSSL